MKKTAVYVFAALVLTTGCGKKTSQQEWNILFILVDDMGWKDLGCYGSDFYETPNIDRLAAEGMLFTNAYAASGVCSPTRASIMTGKSPARLKLTQWIGPEEWQITGEMSTPWFVQQLSLEDTTIAESLKHSGYTTFFAGKWHLGGPEFYPEHQGFDVNIGGNDAGAPPSYFYPYERENWTGTGWPPKIENIRGGEAGEYLTDRLTLEAEHFLDTIGERPFFLYLSHYAIHKPMQSKQELVDYYVRKAENMTRSGEKFVAGERGAYTRQYQDHAVNAAMIHSVDESVGRLVEKLEQMGLRDNTVIIFTSDNGPVASAPVTGQGGHVDYADICAAVLPLRGGKGWYYEGGIRVPLIVSGPAVGTPGAVTETPVSSYDLYPTILEITGHQVKPTFHRDGISFLPVLKGNAGNGVLTDRPLYWHYPHYHTLGQTPASAIRSGEMKLIWWYENETAELYDLGKDPQELNDVSRDFPQITDSLSALLFLYLDQVEADYPYDNREAGDVEGIPGNL